MRKVLTGYAIYFNHKYKRSGYLYQNRYKSILCQEEAYLLELVRYIHLNPMRSKLVKDIDELNRYKWSSHSVLVGENKVEWQSTGEVLERFGKTNGLAIKKYLEFIEDGKDMGRRDDLTGGGLRRSAGGWEGISELKKKKEYWRGDERILGDGEFVNQVLRVSEEEYERKERLRIQGWDLNRLVKEVGEITGLKGEELRRRSKGTKISQARALLSYWGYNELGISGKSLCEYLMI